MGNTKYFGVGMDGVGPPRFGGIFDDFRLAGVRAVWAVYKSLELMDTRKAKSIGFYLN